MHKEGLTLLVRELTCFRYSTPPHNTPFLVTAVERKQKKHHLVSFNTKKINNIRKILSLDLRPLDIPIKKE